MNKLITPKQLSFITKLAGEQTALDCRYLTVSQASAVISGLLSRPRLQAQAANDAATEPATEPAAEPVTEPGVYESADGVFIVKPNREKTRLYAKRLVEIAGQRLTESDAVVNIEFEYAAGAIFRLRASDRMPLERAKALTIRYGRCIVCGRHLKDATSVERGIGPVCVKAFQTA